MTQKKKKSVSSNRHGNSANTNAPKIQKKKKKKSIANTKKANLFNQISNGEEASQKFNLCRCQQKKKKKSVPPCQICKEKRIEEQMDVNQINNGKAVTQKLKLFNQINNGEEATQKFNLCRCLQKNTKKSVLLPCQICKGKRIVEQIHVNQINNGEEATQKFNLCRCQQKKKNNNNNRKKKSVPPCQICKGKSIMEPSNDNTDQIDVDQVIGNHFQEEIMTEILNRLPVRSLLRFRCVSKFWNALIMDPYFKMKHHIRTKNDQNSQKFLITQICTHKVGDVFNFYSSSLSTVQMFEDEQKLDCPVSCKPRFSKIYCSCDGLVLLAILPYLLDKLFLLWNPSTRESIVLPLPEIPLFDCVCGMGYDATSDDYKILAINMNDGYNRDIRIEILALKSGSWRRIGYPTGMHRARGYRDCGSDYLTFLHGAFHWLCKWTVSGHYPIVSFNISNEVYGEIPSLEQMFDVYPGLFIDRGVSVLGGMLCFHCTSNAEGTFMLWVMKEYGVKESWTRLFTIRGTHDHLFYSGRPKHMFANGDVLLLCKRFGNISSVFMTSREPFGLWPETYTIKEGIAYTESLISPKLLT